MRSEGSSVPTGESGGQVVAPQITQRFWVIKRHALKAEYGRVLAVGPEGFATEDPLTGQETNRWKWDQLQQIEAMEDKDGFVLVLQTGSGLLGSKTTVRFRSPCRGELICCLRANKLKGKKKVYTTQKMSKFGYERTCYMIAGESGIVEVDSIQASKVVRAYKYPDIKSIDRLRTDQGEGFILRVGAEGRPHAFKCDDTGGVISSILTSVRASGVDIDFPERALSGQDWKLMCEEYVNAVDTKYILFETRAKKLTKRAESGRKPVRLQITPRHIVERKSKEDVVSSVHLLSRVTCLIQFLDNPHLVEMQFAREERSIRFECGDREALLSHIVDACELKGGGKIDVLLGKSKGALKVCPSRIGTRPDVEIAFLRRLLNTIAQLEGLTKSQALNAMALANNKQAVQRILHVSHEFIANSSVPLRPATLNQLGNNDLHGPGMTGLVATVCALLAQSKPNLVHVIVPMLDAILRVVDRTGCGGQLFNPAMIPELVSTISLSLHAEGAPAVVLRAVKLLTVLCGGNGISADSVLQQENANKSFILSGEVIKKIVTLHATIQDELIELELVKLLELICISGRKTTPAPMYEALICGLVRYPYGMVRKFVHKSSVTIFENSTLLMHAIVYDTPKEAVRLLQLEALRSGAFLFVLFDALFSAKAEHRFACRYLVQLWMTNNGVGHDVLKNIFPPGLYHALSHPRLTPLELEGLRMLGSGGPISENGTLDGQNQGSSESMSKRIEALITDQPAAPEQSILPNNFDVFFHMFEQDHALPDLIWTKQTREELKQALLDEIGHLKMDTWDKRSWNYEEFKVFYPSLANEVRIGDCYLRLLVSPIKKMKEEEELTVRIVEQVREPKVFFSALYNRFLKENVVGSRELVIQCLEAMQKLYKCHHRTIGFFQDIDYLLLLTTKCDGADIRDRLLHVVAALSIERRNLMYLLLQEQSISILIAFLQRTLLSHGGNEWYTLVDGKKTGPVSLASLDLKSELFSIEGLDEMLPKDEMLHLKWALMDEGLLSPDEATLLCLNILQSLVDVHPSVDSNGRPLCPPPKAKRILAAPTSFAYIVQCLLSENIQVATKALCLLEKITTHNPTAVDELNRSGFVYFLLRAQFPQHQQHDGQQKEMDLFKIGARILGSNTAFIDCARSMLPESLLKILQQEPDRFGEMFCQGCNTAQVIWTQDMRQHLGAAINAHLSKFLSRVSSNPYLKYEFQPLKEPVLYESLHKEFYCGGFYLKNLCEDEQHPVANVTEFLRTLLTTWPTTKSNDIQEQLVLRTLAILFKRFGASHLRQGDQIGKTIMEEHQGFPTLMSTISSSEGAVFESATELLYYLCNCFPEYGDNVVQQDGIELLCDKLDKMYTEESMTGAVGNILHCFVGISALKSSKGKMGKPEMFRVFMDVLNWDQSIHEKQLAIQYVLQILSRLAVDTELQNVIITNGILWRIVPLFFQVENKMVITAKHAARAWSRVGGLLTGKQDLVTPRNEFVASLTEILFSFSLAKLFRMPNPSKLLAALNAVNESPTIIWNQDLRAQVLAYVKSQDGNGTLNIDDIQFELEGIGKEPCVRGIYLRIYNERPETQLEEADKFAVQLLQDLLPQQTVNSEEYGVIRLQALVNVLRNSQDAKLDIIANSLILASPPVLFLLPQLAGTDGKIGELALEVLLVSAEKSSVLRDAFVTQKLVLPLVENGLQDEKILQLILNLCSIHTMVSNHIIPSLLLPLLRLVIDKSLDDGPRHLAAKILGATCRDPIHGQQARDKLGLLLPTGLVYSIRNDQIVSALDTFTRNPELIWTEQTRKTLQDHLLNGSLSSTMDRRLEYPSLVDELTAGDVFVCLYLDDPSFALRWPEKFVRGLFERFISEICKRANLEQPSPFVEEKEDTYVVGSWMPDLQPPPIPKRQAMDGPPPPVPVRRAHSSIDKTNITRKDTDENVLETANDTHGNPAPPPRPPRKESSTSLVQKGGETMFGSEALGQDPVLGPLTNAIVHVSRVYGDFVGKAASIPGSVNHLTQCLESVVKKYDDVLFLSCFHVTKAVVGNQVWATQFAKVTNLDQVLVACLDTSEITVSKTVVKMLNVLCDEAEEFMTKLQPTDLEIVVQFHRAVDEDKEGVIKILKVIQARNANFQAILDRDQQLQQDLGIIVENLGNDEE